MHVNKNNQSLKALCVFSHNGKILVAEGYDHVKQEHFSRPLGGGIEFQEKAEDTVIREIREELHAEIENIRFLGVTENIFTYLGKPCHEIVFVYDAEFKDKAFYDMKAIPVFDIKESVNVIWRSKDEFGDGKLKLYPDTLKTLLENLK